MSKQDKKQVNVVLPKSNDYQAIKAKVTENNIEFSTIKKSVESTFSIGKDSAIATLLSEPVFATVTRIESGERVTKTGQLPLAMVLTFASNGLFEQFNTNLRSSADFADQWEAVSNGYVYKSDYQQSLKQPEKDNSFRAFLSGVMDGSIVLDSEQSAQIQRNVIAKGLRLEKGKAPTDTQTAAAIADSKVISFGTTQLAKLEVQLLKLWPWLELALAEHGFARTEIKADDLL